MMTDAIYKLNEKESEIMKDVMTYPTELTDASIETIEVRKILEDEAPFILDGEDEEIDPCDSVFWDKRKARAYII